MDEKEVLESIKGYIKYKKLEVDDLMDTLSKLHKFTADSYITWKQIYITGKVSALQEMIRFLEQYFENGR
jgi:hypothetical protein